MQNNIWFTSDLHFGHSNIVKFTNRNVETSAENHTEWLIDIWNDTVKPGDTVFHLGDFSFYKDVATTIEILKKLNGQKVLIKGNHDHSKAWKKLGEVNGVETYDYLEKKIDDQHICMFHFPIGSWHKQLHGSWHLHGHSHGGYLGSKGKMLDVGIDNAYNMYGDHCFFHYEDIAIYMSDIDIYVADVHRSNL